jgi:hypothetical protein
MAKNPALQATVTPEIMAELKRMAVMQRTSVSRVAGEMVTKGLQLDRASAMKVLKEKTSMSDDEMQSFLTRLGVQE